MTAGTPPRDGNGDAPPVVRGVSLITTLYNEAASVGEFLASVYAMTSLPEEFVIVDGGSTDGTNEAIASHIERHPSPMAVRHIVRPDCNRRVTPGAIARGRNVAISEARCGIIAVTDGGCVLDPDWLARIAAPVLAGADVAGGWYLPDARTSLERCIGAVWLVPPAAVDPENFLPSSRSLAFRKSAWAAAGGYPEHTYYAEDTMFNLALRGRGYRFVYVPEALVRWRMKSSLGAFAKLAHAYGHGDGSNRIMASNLLKSAAKVSVMALLAALAAAAHPAWAIVLFLYLALIAARRRGAGALAPGSLAMLPCAMVIKAIADISYLAGHIRGRLGPPLRPPDGVVQ